MKSVNRAFIDFLVENETPLSNFHLMGHSAGTHLAGGAGAAVTAGKVPRITGNYSSHMSCSFSLLKSRCTYASKQNFRIRFGSS